MTWVVVIVSLLVNGETRIVVHSGFNEAACQGMARTVEATKPGEEIRSWVARCVRTVAN